MGTINIRLTSEAMARAMVEKGKRFDFDYTSGMNAFNNGTNNAKVGDNAYVAQQVAMIVKNEVRLYKNDCQAQLVDFINKSKEYLGNKGVNKASLYTIVELDLPELCKDADDLGIFNSLNSRHPFPDGLPPFNAVEVSDVSSEKASLNKYYKDLFVDTLTAEQVSQILTDALAPSIPFDYLLRLDTIVRGWCLLNFFKEKDINCGLDKTQLVQMIDYIDNKIYKAIELYKEYEKTERVVITTKLVDGTYAVYVVKSIYNTLTGFPGIVDAIFGVALRTDKEYAYSGTLASVEDSKYKTAFLNNREILIRDWNTYIAANTTENAYVRYKRIKYGFKLAFEYILSSVAPELLAYSTFHSKVDMINVFDEYLTTKELYDTNEFIEETAYFAIGKILFNRTNYYKFMTIGDKYLRNNPDVNPEDVIGYIIIELVTELYLGKMQKFDIQ